MFNIIRCVLSEYRKFSKKVNRYPYTAENLRVEDGNMVFDLQSKFDANPKKLAAETLFESDLLYKVDPLLLLDIYKEQYELLNSNDNPEIIYEDLENHTFHLYFPDLLTIIPYSLKQLISNDNIMSRLAYGDVRRLFFYSNLLSQENINVSLKATKPKAKYNVVPLKAVSL